MLKKEFIDGDVVLGKPWTPSAVDRDAVSKKCYTWALFFNCESKMKMWRLCGPALCQNA